MTEVKIPALEFPEVKIPAGQFLNVTLLGTGIVVPPNDVIIIPKLRILDEIKLFDIEDITSPILEAVAKTPEETWNTFWSELNRQVSEYYERRRQGGEG